MLDGLRNVCTATGDSELTANSVLQQRISDKKPLRQPERPSWEEARSPPKLKYIFCARNISKLLIVTYFSSIFPPILFCVILFVEMVDREEREHRVAEQTPGIHILHFKVREC